jgi:hypothetical protein
MTPACFLDIVCFAAIVGREEHYRASCHTIVKIVLTLYFVKKILF